MSAYNSINGTTATENDLLETPLNSDWGFDGVVISDWTAVRSVDSARAATGTVALIGHKAKHARTQGGGSATVLPEKAISPLEGIRATFGSDNVTYSIGAIVQEGVAELPLDQLTNPSTGEPGLRVTFLNGAGAELFAEDRRSTALVWFGGDAPVRDSSTVRPHTIYTPDETGKVRLGAATVGKTRLYVNDVLVHEGNIEVEGKDIAESFLAPPSSTAEIPVEAGVPLEVRVDLDISGRTGPLDNALSVTLGTEPADTDPEVLIIEAAKAAREADVAVVVVGTNSRVESEGYTAPRWTCPAIRTGWCTPSPPRTPARLSSSTPGPRSSCRGGMRSPRS